MNRVIRSKALKEGQGTPQSGARCSVKRGDDLGRVWRTLGWVQRVLRSIQKIW